MVYICMYDGSYRDSANGCSWQARGQVFFYLYSPWLGCNSYYESVNKQKRGRAKIRSEITFKINMNERTKQMYRARQHMSHGTHVILRGKRKQDKSAVSPLGSQVRGESELYRNWYFHCGLADVLIQRTGFAPNVALPTQRYQCHFFYFS